MRPRSYARKPTDTHTSRRTPPRAYTYTPMYTHVRTYTRTRRNFSDNKSVLHHYQTDFHHQSDTIHFYYPITVQSIPILAPHWQRHLYKLSTSVIICYTFTSIYQLSTNHSSLTHLPFIITVSHHNEQSIHASYLIFIQFPVQLIILSICQYVIKPYQFSIYIPRTYIQQFSHLSYPYLIHYYNHFHYGNRIPTQSSAISIMHNYSFIDFRNEIRLKPFCIIIHLNCINIHSFDFHYRNRLLIIGFYYGIHLWDFILSSAVDAHI